MCACTFLHAFVCWGGAFGNWFENLVDLFVWGICAVWMNMDAIEVKHSCFQKVPQKRDKRWEWKRWPSCLLFTSLNKLASTQYGLASAECLLHDWPSHMPSWACLLICKMGLIPCRIVVRVKWQDICENIWQCLAAYQVLKNYWLLSPWSSKAKSVTMVHSTEGDQKAYIKFLFFH